MQALKNTTTQLLDKLYIIEAILGNANNFPRTERDEEISSLVEAAQDQDTDVVYENEDEDGQ